MENIGPHGIVRIFAIKCGRHIFLASLQGLQFARKPTKEKMSRVDEGKIYGGMEVNIKSRGTASFRQNRHSSVPS